MASSGWERVRLRIETNRKISESDASCHISTHILDTTLGKAASDVKISTYYLCGSILHGDGDAVDEPTNNWQLCSKTCTNEDGRVSNVLEPDVLVGGDGYIAGGIYKLHFHVGAYFAAQQYPGYFYPFVEIVVKCTPGQRYHVPLLLNPYGYSTYKGT